MRSDEPATRDNLNALADHYRFDAATRERALTLARILPDSWQWQRFLDRTLLVLAVMMLASAVIFWIAFNWNGMGRFFKLALVEGALVAAVIFAALQKPRTLASQAGLLLSTLLVGPVLALVGQTYQTGADTYELFAVWATLTLPWVALSRWRIAWCVWVVIANVGMQLYFANVWRPQGFSFFDSHGLLAHVLLNGALLWLAEAWGRKSLFGDHASLERLLALFTLVAAVFAYGNAIHDSASGIVALVSILVVAGISIAYRYWRLDVLILAMWSTASIGMVVTTLGRVLHGGGAGAFLLTGMVVIGLSAGAAVWLRTVLRTQRSTDRGVA